MASCKKNNRRVVSNSPVGVGVIDQSANVEQTVPLFHVCCSDEFRAGVALLECNELRARVVVASAAFENEPALFEFCRAHSAGGFLLVQHRQNSLVCCVNCAAICCGCRVRGGLVLAARQKDDQQNDADDDDQSEQSRQEMAVEQPPEHVMMHHINSSFRKERRVVHLPLSGFSIKQDHEEVMFDLQQKRKERCQKGGKNLKSILVVFLLVQEILCNITECFSELCIAKTFCT